MICLAQPILYGLICLWPSRTDLPSAITVATLATAVAFALARIVLHRPVDAESHGSGDQAQFLAMERPFSPRSYYRRSIHNARGRHSRSHRRAAGVFVLSPGGLICLAVGLLLAWVLLVEIQRLQP
jgi:hypothetical protein